jgi:hypothetical protein
MSKKSGRLPQMEIVEIPPERMTEIVAAIDAEAKELGEGMTMDEYHQYERARRLQIFPKLLAAGIDPLQPVAYDHEFGWQAHGLHFEQVPRTKYDFADLAEDLGAALSLIPALIATDPDDTGCCFFCRKIAQGGVIPHDDDCLWYRAKLLWEGRG